MSRRLTPLTRVLIAPKRDISSTVSGCISATPSSRTRKATRSLGLLAARSPGLRLALALEIERHRGADEILQGRLVELVAFVEVDGAPDIPVEAGVE